MNKYIFFFSLLIGAFLFSCSGSIDSDIDKSSAKALKDFSEGFAPVMINDLWGYINTSGEFVIKPQFHEALGFSQKYAAVKLNNKWGFINHKGIFEINPQFDEAKDFFNSIAPVKKDNAWGYINTKGELLIDYQFEDANSFSGDYASVKMGNKWGFINKHGSFEINPIYIEAGCFFEGLAPVKSEHHENKWGYINKHGKFEIEPVYENAKHFSYIKNVVPIAAVMIDGLWGFIDKRGKYKVNPQYEDALTFSEGVSAVKSSGNWGFINDDNKKLIDFNYDNAGIFQNGFSLIVNDNKKYFINKNGKDAGLITISSEGDNIKLGKWKPPEKRIDCLNKDGRQDQICNCNEGQFLNFYNFSKDTVHLSTNSNPQVTALYDKIKIPPLQLFKAKNSLGDHKNYTGFIYITIGGITHCQVWLFTYINKGLYQFSMSLVDPQKPIDSLYFEEYEWPPSKSHIHTLCYKFTKYNVYLQEQWYDYLCPNYKHNPVTVIIENSDEPVIPKKIY